MIMATALTGAATMAQETYENANLARPELNGTARYVGMGGAMEALGADISVIGTNPAGIGLFRHSQATVSFGFVSQGGGATSFYDAKKTNASFDQVGLVWALQTGDNSFLNVAFNYTKERNFDYILSAAGGLEGASQANMTYNKWNSGLLGRYSDTYSQLDYMYMDQFLSDDDDFYDFQGDKYQMNRGQTGYIGSYDFNISGNLGGRVFLGLTVGIHDVHYEAYSQYSETALSGDVSQVMVEDSRYITGTGFDIKAGIIFRPIEESPFRIGLSVSSPVFYDLETSNVSRLSVYEGDARQTDYYTTSSEYYEFRLNTPWKFGASLGHTVGDYLAIGASYEYQDYSSLDTRIKSGLDEWGNQESSSDRTMNNHTATTLKGVSTVKLGLEVKPQDDLALRVGFNYQSAMCDKGGYKDTTLDSPGTYYQSASDFTNWEETYRITAGLGYKWGGFGMDLAYQYSTTQGQFCPFVDGASYSGGELINYGDAVKVDEKRHQLLLTLGYTF